MKKVLLIAFYFNQTNEIASKRLRALAKYLPQYGWEPIVIVPDLGNLNMEGINCNVVQTPYIDMMDKWMGKNKSNLSDESEKQETIIKDSTSVNNQVLSKIVSIDCKGIKEGLYICSRNYDQEYEAFDNYAEALKYINESANFSADEIIINDVINFEKEFLKFTEFKEGFVQDFKDYSGDNSYIINLFV